MRGRVFTPSNTPLCRIFLSPLPQVTITVGEPLDLSDLTCRCHKAGVDQAQVWKDITSRMHEAMERLSAAAPPNPYQRENPVSSSPTRGRTGSVAIAAGALMSFIMMPCPCRLDARLSSSFDRKPISIPHLPLTTLRSGSREWEL